MKKRRLKIENRGSKAKPRPVAAVHPPSSILHPRSKKRGPKPQRPLSYAHDPKHYAAREGCTLRTVNRWMREAAPLDDQAAFQSWLASRKHVPPATRGETQASRPAGQQASRPAVAPPPVAAVVSPSPGGEGRGEGGTIPHSALRTPHSEDTSTGAPAALRRLAEAELSAWNNLELCIHKDPASPFEIKLAHERWLKTGDSLRKYDLMVEQSRRDSGELMPRSEVERILEAQAYYMRMAGQQLAISLADRFAKLDDPAEINHTLNHAMWEQLLGTFCRLAAFSRGGFAVPGWVITAMCRDLEHVLDLIPEIRTERIEIFKELMDQVYTDLPVIPAA